MAVWHWRVLCASTSGEPLNREPLNLRVAACKLQTTRYKLQAAGRLASVVAAAEGFLEPDVEDDEKIAAAHLLDLELGDARFSVGPGDWDDRVVVAASDRLEWHLDGEVEVLGFNAPQPTARPAQSS